MSMDKKQGEAVGAVLGLMGIAALVLLLLWSWDWDVRCAFVECRKVIR